MRQRDLDRLADKLLGPLFRLAGFERKGRLFRRINAEGVIHSIVFELDTRSTPRFSIAAGINATIFADTPGVLLKRYLSRHEMDLNPDHWDAETSEIASESLDHVRPYIETTLWSWFDSLATLVDVADALPAHSSWEKARLYSASGQFRLALKWYEEILAWTQKTFGGSEEGVRRANEILPYYEEAKRRAIAS